MFQCNVIFQVGHFVKHLYNHLTREYPESISESTWSNLIILERGYKKPVKIIKVTWKEVPNERVPKKLTIVDPGMQVIHVGTVQEKIAKLTIQGMAPQCISRELRNITKPELIKIIQEYQTLI